MESLLGELTRSFSEPQVTDQGLVFTTADAAGGDDCVLIARSIPSTDNLVQQVGGVVSWVVPGQDDDDGDGDGDGDGGDGDGDGEGLGQIKQVVYCGDDLGELELLSSQIGERVDQRSDKDSISVAMDLDNEQDLRLVVEGNAAATTRHVAWKYPLDGATLSKLVQQCKLLVWFAPAQVFNKLAYGDKSDDQVNELLKNIETDMPLDQLKQLIQGEPTVNAPSSSAPVAKDDEEKKPKKRLSRQQKRALLARKKK